MKLKAVLLCLSIFILFAQSVWAASVNGKLRWDMQDPTEKYVEEGDWIIKHPLVEESSNHNWPAVLAVESMDEALTVESDKLEVEIVDLDFVSKVYAIRNGMTLSFYNKTSYQLTIDLLYKGEKVNSIVVKPKNKETLVPKQNGRYLLKVKEFSNMRATLLVTDRGRFVSLDNSGKYEFRNLTEGFYKFRLWAGRWVESKEFKLANSESVSMNLKASTKGERLVALSAKKGRVTTDYSAPKQPEPVPVPAVVPQTEKVVPPPVRQMEQKIVPKPAPVVEKPVVPQKKATPKVEQKKEPAKQKVDKAVKAKPEKAPVKDTAKKVEKKKQEKKVKPKVQKKAAQPEKTEEKKEKKKSGGGLFKIKVIE